MFDFIDIKIFLVILHIFGVAIGAGGAFTGDMLFFSSMRDRKISKDELLLLERSGFLVWMGLGLLAMSGLGLFLLNPELYSVSTKFLSKMTIVFALVLNGVLFHALHLPLMKKHVGVIDFGKQVKPWRRNALVASGSVSVISWSWAIVLGVFGGLPFSYTTIILTYLATLIVALPFAFIFSKNVV